MLAVDSVSSLGVPPVAVVVPYGALMPSEFALALRGLEVPPGAVFLGTNARPIDAARNRLARQALDSGARWVLWLDSDTVPPPDALRRLLALGVPFASGVYALDFAEGPRACVYVRGERGYHALGPPYAERSVVEVDGVGFGCALVHRSVFERTPEPWFRWTHGREADGLGEDFYFCERVVEATGIRPVVDLALRVGHVKSRVLWPEAWTAEAAAGLGKG